MDEQSRKAAFIILDGYYEFLRVPFSLCNSPVVFQRFINTVFRDLIQNKVVLTYIDNLIILIVRIRSGESSSIKSIKSRERSQISD